MTLNDLHNPDDISAILVYRTDKFIEIGPNQKFQVLPNMVELWELYDGQLYRLKSWRRTSVCMYTKVYVHKI